MVDSELEAHQAATAFREEHGLHIAPVADVVALIEQTQAVDVTVVEAQDDEHGLTMMDPARGVAIVAVAASPHPMRWRSTLAHELGHLVFGDYTGGNPGAVSTDPAVESRAQSFARHLLIPLEGVEHFLERRHGPLDLAAFSDLVQRFEVSPAITALQLSHFNVIDEATFEEWRSMFTPALAARFGWLDQYQALSAESRQRRAPQRLLARMVAGYVAGLVSLESVASVRGSGVDALAEEFAAAGISPVERIEELPEDDILVGADPDVDLSWLDDA